MNNNRVKFFVYSIAIATFTITSVQSQQNKQATLLTVADTPVSSSEFKRVYLKNLDLVKDESQKDVEQYLKLFIDYKLKIKEALASGLDKKQTYIDELASYRKQLAGSYLTDTNVTDALVKEAYDHLQESVNASHILIRMEPGAIPADTLKAYNRIIEARNRIVNGEDFKVVAKEYSEDPSAQTNGGDLGWFSAFRMVYPFEKAAFETKVGDVSNPFTTQFGYHILKVNDHRKASEKISVAHIMLGVRTDDQGTEAEEKIKDIYQQLEQGAEFETLASQFSEDRYTSSNGGVLKEFSFGELNAPKFEETAFSLTKKGEYSKPIRSDFGWHIIKFIEKHPPLTFEEMKADLTEKVKKDTRSKLITDAFIEKLKKQYQVTDNNESVKTFYKDKFKVGDTVKVQITEGDAYKEKLLQIQDSVYTYAKFSKFLGDTTVGEVIKDVDSYVDKYYNKYVSETLLTYYEANLERDNEDFAAVMTEYRDGLLLFDLMESKIWNVAKTDSIGLQKYYDAHKDKYQWNERYKIQKASTEKKEIAEQVKTLWSDDKTLDEIKEIINTDGATNVIFTNETVSKEDNTLPESFKVDKDSIQFFEDKGYYTILQVAEVLPPGPKKLEETKGKVINDFQKEIEEKWIAELRNTYAIKVNKKTLKKIKKELKN